MKFSKEILFNNCGMARENMFKASNRYTAFYFHFIYFLEIQWTLVISKSKGPSETLRDTRSSAYQIWRIEENTSGTTKFHK